MDWDLSLSPQRDRFVNEAKPLGQSSLEPHEEMALMVGMHYCLRKEVLELSECPHRAVAATVFVELPTCIEKEEALSEMEKRGILGTVLTIREHDYLYVLGVNSWTDDIAEPLDCKKPGIPWDMGLRSLEDGSIISSRSEVDQACPKRVSGATCNIKHAEPVALEGFIEITKALKIEDVDNAFIVCTWVNCPNCLNLLHENRDLFKGANVISIFWALGDEDDEGSIDDSYKLFTWHREGWWFRGPYAPTGKEPGYGWIGVDHELLAAWLENKGQSMKAAHELTPREEYMFWLLQRAAELAMGKMVLWIDGEEVHLDES